MWGKVAAVQEELKSELSNSVMSFPACERPTPVSQEAVLSGHEGEPIESIAGAGASAGTGGELWGPTHRAGNHFSGELWIDVLDVSWTSL